MRGEPGFEVESVSEAELRGSGEDEQSSEACGGSLVETHHDHSRPFRAAMALSSIWCSS